MVNILITDDHPVVRRGIKGIVTDLLDEVSIDEATNSFETFDRVRDKNYDLVILGISEPGSNGINTLEQIKRNKPDCPILLFSIYPEEPYAVIAFKAGASGYLPKESNPDEIAFAINKLLSGEKYISTFLKEYLVSLIQEPPQQPYDLLSIPEFQVLCSVASGKEYNEIAGELSVSKREVKKYLFSIFKKTGMKNNIELTIYAKRCHLVS